VRPVRGPYQLLAGKLARTINRKRPGGVLKADRLGIGGGDDCVLGINGPKRGAYFGRFLGCSRTPEIPSLYVNSMPPSSKMALIAASALRRAQTNGRA
jgi:hypothetical protein